MIQAIGFDWDDTLARRFTAEPLPGVRERLAAIPAGIKTFIATNQAGCTYRAVLGDTQYPTPEQIVANLAAGLLALDWWPDHILIAVGTGIENNAEDGLDWMGAAYRVGLEFVRIASPVIGFSRTHISHLPGWRKPRSGMMTRGAHLCGASVSHTIYIGDMVTDKAAAETAGCGYLATKDWIARGFAEGVVFDSLARPC